MLVARTTVLGYVREVGFLDRVIGAVNKVGTPIDSLTDTIGPSRYKKGQNLESEGRPVAGRIAGIERKLDSGDDTELFALEFTGPDGPVLAGTRIRTQGMERLRLGMPVLLRSTTTATPCSTGRPCASAGASGSQSPPSGRCAPAARLGRDRHRA